MSDMHDKPLILYRHRLPYEALPIRRSDFTLPEAESAVARWIEMFGLPEAARDADFEDWHEAAVQLFVAVDSGLPVVAMEHGERDVVRQAFNGAPTAVNPEHPRIEIGGRLRRRPGEPEDPACIWPPADAMRAALRYFDNPAFHRHAGRLTATAFSMTDDGAEGGSNGLVRAIQRVARQTGPDVAVKIVTRLKHAPVQFFKGFDPEDTKAIERWLFETFEWDLVHIDDGLPEFLVQERIDIGLEYRTAVIDGQVVAGAGCIEHFCPLYGNNREVFDPDRPAFDPNMEERRGDGIVISDPGRAEAYALKAQEIADDMIAEDPAFRNIVLDVGSKPDGSIVLIEANPIEGFGLYAMDYRRVFEAIVTATGVPPVLRGSRFRP